MPDFNSLPKKVLQQLVQQMLPTGSWPEALPDLADLPTGIDGIDLADGEKFLRSLGGGGERGFSFSGLFETDLTGKVQEGSPSNGGGGGSSDGGSGGISGGSGSPGDSGGAGNANNRVYDHYDVDRFLVPFTLNSMAEYGFTDGYPGARAAINSLLQGPGVGMQTGLDLLGWHIDGSSMARMYFNNFEIYPQETPPDQKTKVDMMEFFSGWALDRGVQDFFPHTSLLLNGDPGNPKAKHIALNSSSTTVALVFLFWASGVELNQMEVLERDNNAFKVVREYIEQNPSLGERRQQRLKELNKGKPLFDFTGERKLAILGSSLPFTDDGKLDRDNIEKTVINDGFEKAMTEASFRDHMGRLGFEVEFEESGGDKKKDFLFMSNGETRSNWVNNKVGTHTLLLKAQLKLGLLTGEAKRTLNEGGRVFAVTNRYGYEIVKNKSGRLELKKIGERHIDPRLKHALAKDMVKDFGKNVMGDMFSTAILEGELNEAMVVDAAAVGAGSAVGRAGATVLFNIGDEMPLMYSGDGVGWNRLVSGEPVSGVTGVRVPVIWAASTLGSATVIDGRESGSFRPWEVTKTAGVLAGFDGVSRAAIWGLSKLIPHKRLFDLASFVVEYFGGPTFQYWAMKKIRYLEFELEMAANKSELENQIEDQTFAYELACQFGNKSQALALKVKLDQTWENLMDQVIFGEVGMTLFEFQEEEAELRAELDPVRKAQEYMEENYMSPATSRNLNPAYWPDQYRFTEAEYWQKFEEDPDYWPEKHAVSNTDYEEIFIEQIVINQGYLNLWLDDLEKRKNQRLAELSQEMYYESISEPFKPAIRDQGILVERGEHPLTIEDLDLIGVSSTRTGFADGIFRLAQQYEDWQRKLPPLPA